MKERPILMSAPMVRALLAGTKTQTRRECKPAQFYSLSAVVEVPDPKERRQVYNGSHFGDEDGDVQFASPYGGRGDRLWVRETHAPQPDCSLAWERWMNGHGGEKPIIHYAADASERAWVEKWRPSIHMPRWASRITLEVTGVRVERLQDISEADALAEGSFTWSGEQETPVRDLPEARLVYRQLWEEINGPGSWDANPWVWVVTFK